MKKFFWRFSILTALFFSLYASRHFFLRTALEFGVKRATGTFLAYDHCYWEDGRLFYENFSLGEQLYTQEAAFDFTFHLFPFSIDAAVHLDNPLIQMEGEASQTNLAFLVPAKFWTVKCDIEKGSLLSGEKKLCLFDFVSGLGKEEIGKLIVYQEDGAPLFTCGFNYQDGLAVDFQMDEAPLEKTVPLVSLFYPLPTWKLLEGIASAAIKGNIGIEKMSSLQGHFSLQDVRLESDQLIFAADKAASQIDFRGDLETLALDTDFNGVDLFWKELEVLRGQGSIVFKPRETPVFEAHAAVHVAELEGRADIVGKGKILDHSLCLEGILDYVTAGNPLRVDFSWTDDGKAQILQTQIRNLGKEILGLLNSQIKQGSLDGQATVYLDQGIFDRLHFENMQIHQLTIDNLLIQETKFQGSLNLLSGDIEQLTLEVADVEGEFQGWKISSTQAAIAIQDNTLEPSSAFGKFENVPFSLQLQGPLSSFHASAKLIGGASEWMKLPKNPQEPNVALDLTFDRNQDELQILGTATCLEDTVQLNGKADLSTASVKGGFQTSRIQSSFYLPFLKIVAPTLVLQGDISLRGQFSEKSVDVLAQGDDLIVTSPDFKLSVLGQSREILYHFDFHEKKGDGKGKLSPLLFTTSQFSLPISVSDGEIAFNHTSLFCKKLTGQINEIGIQGDLTAHWEEELEANFLAQKVEGSLESLIAAAAPFYQLPVELVGRFSSSPEGMQLHYANGKYNYRIDMLLDQIEGILTPQLEIKKTSCSLTFDSLENQLVVQNLAGTLSEDLTFSAQEIRYKNGEWDFDANVDQESRPFLSLQGKALETPLGYQVTLNEAKAQESHLKSPLSFHWTPPSKMEQVRGVVYIDTATLVEQLSVLDRLGLFTATSGFNKTLQQIQGSMTIRLTTDADQAEYEIQGNQIFYGSTQFNSVDALLVQQGNQWSLKRCVLDEVQILGEAALQNGKWVVSACNIDWKDLKIHAAGIYDKEKFDFNIEGEITPRFSLKGGGIFFSAEPQFQNLSLKVLDKADPLAFLICDQITYQNGTWESPNLELSIFSKQLSEPLRTKLQLSLSSKSTTFQGVASQGEVKIGEGALKMKQIYGLYEAPYLNLKCTAAFGDEPLHFLAKLSKDHQFGGGVNIQRGKEVLKLLLSDPATCQKAEGELFGVNVNLQREAQNFKGTVIVKDSTQLADLLGNDSLKDFSGLQLNGLFSKETFKGELEGHDARVKEYLVQELRATVDYTPTRFRLKNLTLQDPAGSFTVKECNGFRTDALDKWNVTIPLIKGQEIKPSAIRKLGASQKEIKPLQIRYFVMTDVLGQLGDLSSFRGLGRFNFTQRVKKEPSLFDIPLAFLKDMGLDLDLFSPIMGEVELQLKDGKLFFTDLQNAFSEGKRSEFYLAAEPSYIDLNGGLFLNLRMQQNVVLKFVEPFMIAVRGTWEKPKYSLQ